MRLTLSPSGGVPICPGHLRMTPLPCVCQMESGAHVLLDVPDWRRGKLRREHDAHELSGRLSWAVRWPLRLLCCYDDRPTLSCACMVAQLGVCLQATVDACETMS